MTCKEIPISTPFIKLDALLKFSAIAGTGGTAKILILQGDIKVNGEVCLQRGKKIKAGDEVAYGDTVIKVVGQ